MLWHCWLGGRKGIRPVKIGGLWTWALVSPDGVAPSRMVGVSASVNLPLHHKVQKFSSGTGSPGWSWKKGHKTVVVWCGGSCSIHYSCGITTKQHFNCLILIIYYSPCIWVFTCMTISVALTQYWWEYRHLAGNLLTGSHYKRRTADIWCHVWMYFGYDQQGDYDLYVISCILHI